VAAELYTDFPERFSERRRLWGEAPHGERRELELEEFWPHKGRIVLKFRGVDSIDAAEQLAGWEIQIPREQRAPLEPGAAYVSDLVGCRVVVGGRELGQVAEVQFGAGAAPLLVVHEGGSAGVDRASHGKRREFLLPWAEEFIEQLDMANRIVRLRVPEGLLELDRPPTVEERAEQQAASQTRRQRNRR
jgi:16S rRNA processing protein RimM